MSLRHIVWLLPGGSWDEFCAQADDSAAAEAWVAATGVWHPVLLAAAEAIPESRAADAPPSGKERDTSLFVVPSASRELLPHDWKSRDVPGDVTNGAPPMLVHVTADREEAVSALLAAAGLSSAAAGIDADVVADFYALGYAYQQTMRLTSSIQYASVFEAETFLEAVVAAARAAVAGDQPSASSGIDRALDLLANARNHYYSVDVYLIDMKLVAESTLGEPLRCRLTDGHATSLLADANMINQMASRAPETLVALRQAIAAGKAAVAGGRIDSSALEPLGPEAWLYELAEAQRRYRAHLANEVSVFAQFGAAFSPVLPGMLAGLGFRGALHAAFDGGPLPLADQRKTRWSDGDNASLDALSTTPLDAAQAATWLTLADKISQSISRDHVATVLLAGWPGHEFAAYDDLLRIAKRSPLLGRLVTLDEYFDSSSSTDLWRTFQPTDYSTAVAPTGEQVASRIAAYRREVIDVHRSLLAGLSQFAPEAASDAAGGTHWRTLNAWNFDSAYYHGLELVESTPRQPAPTADRGPLYFMRAVPGCGFGWHADRATPAPATPIATGRRLRNEQVEVTVGESTGGIQSLRAHNDRGTRVSQRLVLCEASHVNETPPGQTAEPRMVADELAITRNDALVGEITSRGRLTDARGDLIARFVQTVRLPRAMSAVLVDVALTEIRLTKGGGWANSIASRVAWREEGAKIDRGANWTRRSASRREIESAEWVEIEQSVGRTTIFPFGLPLHRRFGETMLDTLLAVAGESEVCRQFAIGLDIAYPTRQALSLLTADRVAASRGSQGAADRGWFFHVDANNVVVTHLAPLESSRGGRVRLLETEGRSVRAELACFRPLTKAEETDFNGQAVRPLRIEEGSTLR